MKQKKQNKKQAKVAKVAGHTVEKAAPGTGVGNYVYGLLAGKATRNLPNGKLAEMARKKFKTAKTTPACISWYKGHPQK